VFNDCSETIYVFNNLMLLTIVSCVEWKSTISIQELSNLETLVFKVAYTLFRLTIDMLLHINKFWNSLFFCITNIRTKQCATRIGVYANVRGGGGKEGNFLWWWRHREAGETLSKDKVESWTKDIVLWYTNW
jgi:hypothetical protein